MPPRKSKATNWAALIEHEMKKQTTAPDGEGWQTFEEIRKESGRGHQTVRSFLRKGIAAGAVESFRGTALNSSGAVVPAMWYRERAPE